MSMEIIICQSCKSEIAVDDIHNYDVDCDCGNVLTSSYMKINVNENYNHCITKVYKVPRKEWENIREDKNPGHIADMLKEKYDEVDREEDVDTLPTYTVEVR